MFKLNRILGEVPNQCRVYAIGDIHGRADLLVQLLEKIVDDNMAQSIVERQVIIFLGDYIDRGPGSCDVIDILTSELPNGYEFFFLKGNHEAMMLEAMKNRQALPTWFHNGGQKTLLSYGINPERYIVTPGEALKLGELLAEKMPDRHKKFFRKLRLSVSIGDYFFVHAGVNPVTSIENQKERDLLWIRQRFLKHKRKFEKIIIHGHSVSNSPDLKSNRIGIDTGAWKTGKLTALRLQDRDYAFITT